MNRTISVCVFLVTLAAVPALSQPEFGPDSVRSICKRVASGRLKAALYNGWQFGTFFEGVMALYDLTQDKRYLDSTVAWAGYNKWLSASAKQDTIPVSFDDVCCYQAYLETYLADPSPARLENIKAALRYITFYTYDTCPNTCKDIAWPIVDQYHMAAPIYPRAAVILNDPVMFDTAYHFAVQSCRRHYNVKAHLFNSNCGDTNATRQWWSRGCGWGVCGTCRLHQYLPAGHPGRTWCEQRIRETCAKLITLQDQTDGMWRSELFTPGWLKESSGTGFFCYELFYALRHGIVDTATYLGSAKKAWSGLVGCVGADPANPNMLGWSQAIGGGPSNNISATGHNEYTDGAFLMAGNELYHFLTEGITGTNEPVPARGAKGDPMASHNARCAVLDGLRLTPPLGARAVEIFSPSGRLLQRIQIDVGARNGAVFLGRRANGVGIVRFVFP
jgi:unsaturated rhamnogalacturonyl hydrolase